MTKVLEKSSNFVLVGVTLKGEPIAPFKREIVPHLHITRDKRASLLHYWVKAKESDPKQQRK